MQLDVSSRASLQTRDMRMLESSRAGIHPQGERSPIAVVGGSESTSRLLVRGASVRAALRGAGRPSVWVFRDAAPRVRRLGRCACGSDRLQKSTEGVRRLALPSTGGADRGSDRGRKLALHIASGSGSVRRARRPGVPSSSRRVSSARARVRVGRQTVWGLTWETGLELAGARSRRVGRGDGSFDGRRSGFRWLALW